MKKNILFVLMGIVSIMGIAQIMPYSYKKLGNSTKPTNNVTKEENYSQDSTTVEISKMAFTSTPDYPEKNSEISLRSPTKTKKEKVNKFYYLDINAYNKLNNLFFSRAISLNNESPIMSNQISVAPEKTEVGVNFSYPFSGINDNNEDKFNAKENRILFFLSGNIKAGLGDNIVTLIRQRAVTPGTSVALNLSFPLKGKFDYDDDEMEKKRKEDILTNLFYNKRLLKVKLDLTEFEEKAVLLNIDINSILDSLQLSNLNETQKYRLHDRLYNDSILLLQNIKNINEINQDKVSKNINKERNDSLIKLYLNIKYSTIRLMWFDMYGSFNAQFFNLLNDTNSLSSFKNQITPNKFTGYTVGVAFNFFLKANKTKWDVENVKKDLLNGYFRIAYEFSKLNNINYLEVLDVTQSYLNSSDSLSGITRIANKGISTFDNVDPALRYCEFYVHKLSFDTYKFFTRKDILAVHLFYSQLFNYKKQLFSNGKCLADLGFGFVVSSINKSNSMPVINIEPYIKFYDLLNAMKEYNEASGAPKLHKRYELGIRLNVPIGSLFKEN